MDDPLYVAMTGAQQTMVAQTVHSNNLANVNTTGFRGDLYNAYSVALFGETFPSSVYAVSEEPVPNFKPGGLMTTGRDLDVAIQDKGWIAVQAPNGDEAYTRAGDLQIDGNGQLRTGAGHPVLGNGGPISIPPAEKIQIGGDGSITVIPLGSSASAPAQVDRIKLVNPDTATLRKGEDGLLRSSAAVAADAGVRLAPGALETSNVNAVDEMINIIALARQFEIQMKMMQAVDENGQATAQLLQA